MHVYMHVSTCTSVCMYMCAYVRNFITFVVPSDIASSPPPPPPILLGGGGGGVTIAQQFPFGEGGGGGRIGQFYVAWGTKINCGTSFAWGGGGEVPRNSSAEKQKPDQLNVWKGFISNEAIQYPSICTTINDYDCYPW